MKTLIIILSTILFTSITPVWAQSEQYKQAMTDALATMKGQSEKTPLPDMLATANQFERIAGAEPKEWLPRYYASLLYVYLGFMGKEAADKDKYLDQADKYLKEAQALSPQNDELAVLKAYIAQSRMVVDPMNRWQTYGQPFQDAIAEAKSLNANNPRPYVLEGSGLFYTPEQFGGGAKAACPILNKAVEKFTTFKPISDLHPTWGKSNIEPMLAQCPK